VSDLPTPPDGCDFLELNDDEARLVAANELEVADYLVVRLPPTNNPMQMQVLTDGSHALLQPFHMPKGTMAWQLPTSIVGLDGKPIAQIKPGDILGDDMRILVRRGALAETPELPPLPKLSPLEAP
jgi:hypothetical protein